MEIQVFLVFFKGSDLDYNCKKWRLFADILNDSAMMIELMAPLWPKWTFQVSFFIFLQFSF